MDIHITQPDLEAKLTQSAGQQGRHPDELAQEVLAQYFDEEARFVAAVSAVTLHPSHFRTFRGSSAREVYRTQMPNPNLENYPCY